MNNKLVDETIKLLTENMLLEYAPDEIKQLTLPSPTNKRDFKGFDTSIAGNGSSSLQTELLPDNQYRKYQLEKGRFPDEIASGTNDEDYWWNYNDAYIAEITPQEYFDLCYKYIFKKSIPDITNEEQMAKISEINIDKAKKYAQQMQEGIKFYTPYIDFRTEGQEGRHRAYAAYLNGYQTIPCEIII